MVSESALSMAGMDRKTAKKYGIENPNKFVQILPDESQQQQQTWQRQMVCERTEGGVLSHTR